MSTRHLLDVDDLSTSELFEVIENSANSANSARKASNDVLKGAGVALLFAKPSNRTRNAAELAVSQLGGHPVYIQAHEVGVDERESVEDVTRTLSCYHDVICARVFEHSQLIRMAASVDEGVLGVPIVNLLSDFSHPTQAIADMITLCEHFCAQSGATINPHLMADRTIAYIGDSNNVTRSLAKAAVMVGISINVASPPGYCFDDSTISEIELLAQESGLGATLSVTTSPRDAVHGVDAVYTDVWTSMGQENEQNIRRQAFSGYCVDDSLLGFAKSDAVVMHCLPAHRGEEISSAVIDGPRSIVWRQAFHRMTAMRSVLEFLIEANGGVARGQTP